MTVRSTTPNYSLPYPGDSDIPDVPKDLSALALAVDAALGTVATNANTGAQSAAAAAVRALASGVWGQGALSKFGANANILNGQPLYFDSANQLRAQPLLIESGKFTDADTPSKYPLGVSLMTLATADATSGHWPMNASAFVLTMIRVGDSPSSPIGGQLWFINTASSSSYYIKYRGASGANVWGAWLDLHDDGMQNSIAAGTYRFNMTSAGQTIGQKITFPAGRFSAVPNVYATVQTTIPSDSRATIEYVHSTDFTLFFYRTTNVDTTVQWMAIQQY